MSLSNTQLESEMHHGLAARYFSRSDRESIWTRQKPIRTDLFDGGQPR